MFITQVEFRVFDKDSAEFFVTQDPIMEKALIHRLHRNYSNTAILQRVVTYEAVELKEIQEDKYDMHGKRITPDINKEA